MVSPPEPKAPGARNRIDRVTTRHGDGGETTLADGRRYRKSDAAVELLGALDEANSWLGLLAVEADGRGDADLQAIQSCLFDAGGIAAGGKLDADWPALITAIEAQTATLNGALSPLREFLLPGGGRAAAIAHVARTVVRRAERAWWRAAGENERLRRSEASVYLNRLSDFLFVYARTLAESERLWRGPVRSASATDKTGA